MIIRVRAVFADPDRGSEPVALAILAPVMLLLVGLLVVGGRVALASESIAGVASNAARVASIARTPGEAGSIATASAQASLQAQNLHCDPAPQVAKGLRPRRCRSGFPTSRLIETDVTRSPSDRYAR